MGNGFYHIHSAGGYGSGAPLPERDILKTQVEIIRDVMLSASACNTWLTLHEIAELTRFGEASISAQLRHLRKPIFGGYDVRKRRRFGAGQIMVVRERRMADSGVVWNGDGSASCSAPSVRRRRVPASLRRAFGLKPGSWEYCVAP